MITSGTVTLRPVRRDDLDDLYRLITDAQTWELRRADPPRPVTREGFEAWYLPRIDAVFDVDSGAEFAIESGGDLIGRCGLYSVDQFARHA